MPDEVLGYRHRAGRFEVNQSGLHFVLNHGDDTLRVTTGGSLGGCHDDRPQIWILGGSFTHGWMVNDSESFPWIVQTDFPQYCVRNFGVSGYGAVNSLLQLEQELTAGEKPALAVVAYGSFHDRRNVFSRERRKTLVPWSRVDFWPHPKASIDSDGALELAMVDVEYSAFPGNRALVLANFIENAWNRFERILLREREVTLAILERIEGIAVEANFDVLIATLTQDSSTEALLGVCRERGWSAVDISHDYFDPKLNTCPPTGIRMLAGNVFTRMG
ncbi:MAG: hypothetical protein ACI8TX_001717 [Hyphomicrobiaceae bacterium]|jgi:hypothetical protein